MPFQTWRPSAVLAPHVAFYWYADFDVTGGADAERVLPDGAMQLIVNLRDQPMRVYDRDDPSCATLTPPMIVTGPSARYALISRADTARTVGVSFRPGGAAAFLGCALADVVDRDADVAALWGRAVTDEIRNRVLEASTTTAIAAVLDEVLVRRLQPRRVRHAAVAWAVDELRRVPATMTVAGIVGQVGLSHRRFLDHFRDAVGLSPKRFGRVQRFQAVVRGVGAPDDHAWADLAQACGYADQAHLSRDFRAFSGITPEAYRRRRTSFANHVSEA